MRLTNPTPQIFCSQCHSFHQSIQIFHAHLATDHNIFIKRLAFVFNEQSSFKKWLAKERNIAGNRFTCIQPNKSAANYFCNSGIHDSGTTNRKAEPNVSGIEKTCITCPAFISAVYKNKKYCVRYFPNHLNHAEVIEKNCQKDQAAESKDSVSDVEFPTEHKTPPSRKSLSDTLRSSGDSRSQDKPALLNLQSSRSSPKVGSNKKTSGSSQKRKRPEATPPPPLGLNVEFSDEESDGDEPHAWIYREHQERGSVVFFKPLQAQHNRLKTNELLLVIQSNLQRNVMNALRDASLFYISVPADPDCTLNVVALFVPTEEGYAYPVAFAISNYLTEDIVKMFLDTMEESMERPLEILPDEEMRKLAAHFRCHRHLPAYLKPVEYIEDSAARLKKCAKLLLKYSRHACNFSVKPRKRDAKERQMIESMDFVDNDNGGETLRGKTGAVQQKSRKSETPRRAKANAATRLSRLSEKVVPINSTEWLVTTELDEAPATVTLFSEFDAAMICTCSEYTLSQSVCKHISLVKMFNEMRSIRADLLDVHDQLDCATVTPAIFDQLQGLVKNALKIISADNANCKETGNMLAKVKTEPHADKDLQAKNYAKISKSLVKKEAGCSQLQRQTREANSQTGPFEPEKQQVRLALKRNSPGVCKGSDSDGLPIHESDLSGSPYEGTEGLTGKDFEEECVGEPGQNEARIMSCEKIERKHKIQKSSKEPRDTLLNVKTEPHADRDVPAKTSACLIKKEPGLEKEVVSDEAKSERCEPENKKVRFDLKRTARDNIQLGLSDSDELAVNESDFDDEYDEEMEELESLINDSNVSDEYAEELGQSWEETNSCEQIELKREKKNVYKEPKVKNDNNIVYTRKYFADVVDIFRPQKRPSGGALEPTVAPMGKDIKSSKGKPVPKLPLKSPGKASDRNASDLLQMTKGLSPRTDVGAVEQVKNPAKPTARVTAIGKDGQTLKNIVHINDILSAGFESDIASTPVGKTGNSDLKNDSSHEKTKETSVKNRSDRKLTKEKEDPRLSPTVIVTDVMNENIEEIEDGPPAKRIRYERLAKKATSTPVEPSRAMKKEPSPVSAVSKTPAVPRRLQPARNAGTNSDTSRQKASLNKSALQRTVTKGKKQVKDSVGESSVTSGISNKSVDNTDEIWQKLEEMHAPTELSKNCAINSGRKVGQKQSDLAAARSLRSFGQNSSSKTKSKRKLVESTPPPSSPLLDDPSWEDYFDVLDSGELVSKSSDNPFLSELSHEEPETGEVFCDDSEVSSMS